MFNGLITGVEIHDMLRESKWILANLLRENLCKNLVFLYIHNQCIGIDRLLQFLRESIWILTKSPEGESL